MKKQFIVPTLILVGVIVALAISAVAVWFWGKSWTERGTIGDSFGLSNALFSGLAFAGVVYAILLQRDELSLQRQELSLTRNELSKTAKAQEQTAFTQTQLAQLNAYTALMTYKLANLEQAERQLAKKPHDAARTIMWRQQHRNTQEELTRLEAYIENILFSVGGTLTPEPFDIDKAIARLEEIRRGDGPLSDSKSDPSEPPA